MKVESLSSSRQRLLLLSVEQVLIQAGYKIGINFTNKNNQIWLQSIQKKLREQYVISTLQLRYIQPCQWRDLHIPIGLSISIMQVLEEESNKQQEDQADDEEEDTTIESNMNYVPRRTSVHKDERGNLQHKTSSLAKASEAKNPVTKDQGHDHPVKKATPNPSRTSQKKSQSHQKKGTHQVETKAPLTKQRAAGVPLSTQAAQAQETSTKKQTPTGETATAKKRPSSPKAKPKKKLSKAPDLASSSPTPTKPTSNISHRRTSFFDSYASEETEDDFLPIQDDVDNRPKPTPQATAPKKQRNDNFADSMEFSDDGEALFWDAVRSTTSSNTVQQRPAPPTRTRSSRIAAATKQRREMYKMSMDGTVHNVSPSSPSAPKHVAEKDLVDLEIGESTVTTPSDVAAAAAAEVPKTPPHRTKLKREEAKKKMKKSTKILEVPLTDLLEGGNDIPAAASAAATTSPGRAARPKSKRSEDKGRKKPILEGEDDAERGLRERLINPIEPEYFEDDEIPTLPTSSKSTLALRSIGTPPLSSRSRTRKSARGRAVMGYRCIATCLYGEVQNIKSSASMVWDAIALDKQNGLFRIYHRSFVLSTTFQRALVHAKTGEELKSTTIHTIQINLFVSTVLLVVAVLLTSIFPYGSVDVYKYDNNDAEVLVPETVIVHPNMAIGFTICSMIAILAWLSSTMCWLWTLVASYSVSPTNYKVFLLKSMNILSTFGSIMEFGTMVFLGMIYLVLWSRFASIAPERPTTIVLAVGISAVVAYVASHLAMYLSSHVARVAFHGLLLSDDEPNTSMFHQVVGRPSSDSLQGDSSDVNLAAQLEEDMMVSLDKIVVRDPEQVMDIYVQSGQRRAEENQKDDLEQLRKYLRPSSPRQERNESTGRRQQKRLGASVIE